MDDMPGFFLSKLQTSSFQGLTIKGMDDKSSPTVPIYRTYDIHLRNISWLGHFFHISTSTHSVES